MSNNFSLACVTVLIVFMTAVIAMNFCSYTAFAHLSDTSVQEWISQKDGVKIQFNYEPKIPIISTFTELKFSVQNLTTSEHLKDFSTRVTVTQGARIFTFGDMTVNDGDFSVKFAFPEDGTHKVLVRIDTENTITVGTFSVFVPHQSPPSLLNPFPGPPGTANENPMIKVILLAAIAGSVGAVTLFIVKRNKRR